MKKTLGIFFAVALLVCQIAWADQPTTVLTETRTAGGVALDVPVLDGVNNETFQQSANQLLSEAAQDTARKTGRQGKVTYEVTLNRPSLVSILFKGTNGGHAYYRALNIDLTTGREFTPDTFFFNNDARKALLGAKTENTLFTEEGIALSAKNGAPYDRLYSYGQLMPMARIGDIGRLLTVWKLTESSNGKTLTVRPGSLLAIKLSANPSTGFQWVPVITGGVDKGLTKVCHPSRYAGRTDGNAGNGSAVLYGAAARNLYAEAVLRAALGKNERVSHLSDHGYRKIIKR